MADRRRIVQVLDNLFANAASHAPESTPIRVAAAREDAHVAVSVSDEASGVAPELLPHLFSKHSGSKPRAMAGHGLGLAISNGLVEAHGGRIRAESAGAAGRAFAELAAQVPDEVAHEVRAGGLRLGADPPQQPLEGHDPSRVEREHAQQFVLRGGQVDRLAADRHPAVPVVDGEVSDRERLGFLAAPERPP